MRQKRKGKDITAAARLFRRGSEVERVRDENIKSAEDVGRRLKNVRGA